MPMGLGHIKVPYEKSVKTIAHGIRLNGPAVGRTMGNGPMPTNQARGGGRPTTTPPKSRGA